MHCLFVAIVSQLALAADLKIEIDKPILYKAKNCIEQEWGFAYVTYQGEPSVEGYFEVDGKPVKYRIDSTDSDVVKVYNLGETKEGDDDPVTTELGEFFEFKTGGEIELVVKLGESESRCKLTVVELPFNSFPEASPAEDVIKAWGLPSQKSRAGVSWPRTAVIDGIYYSAQPGGAVLREHWFYEKHPGLAISVGSGKVMDIGSFRPPETDAENFNEALRAKALEKTIERRRFDVDAEIRAEELAALGYRIWRSANGKFEVHALLVEFKIGPPGVVLLKRADDEKIIEVPMASLNAEDQSWARKELKARAKAKREQERIERLQRKKS